MREIVLDTETTGFDPSSGDRIVEIGAVELFNHMPTGDTYHQYINPQRPMPKDAFDIHGLADKFLADKPVFKDIAADFIAFIGTAKLVIHNASFDMKFLNAELDWVNRDKLPMDQAIDTLEIARRKFPGAQNSLDALCRRFAVDNTDREKHGALLDSKLLAAVYLELIGGRQPDLVLAAGQRTTGSNVTEPENWKPSARPNKLPPRLTDQEAERHKAFIETLGDSPHWSKLH
ncbi:MAG: DNA polymerase III subunit epsilon [Alphaproteobacteria bacterium]|nr:DNA polymerase III subunit epsilon [Alphaproteobacteria bacterium]